MPEPVQELGTMAIAVVEPAGFEVSWQVMVTVCVFGAARATSTS